MRNVWRLAVSIAPIVSACPALAGEKPVFAGKPEWVAISSTPAPADLIAGNIDIPLFDSQTFVDGDKVSTYTDIAYRIATPQALNELGTVKFEWQPDKGDLIVHAVEILRDGKSVDILGDGSRLTVLRREMGLERLVVDGTLTATMPAEGLRVGDVLRVVSTVTSRDEVLGGHAQALMPLLVQPLRTKFARVRLVWPEKQTLAWKTQMPGVTAQPAAIAGGRRELVVPLPLAKLGEFPDNVPTRLLPAPFIEAGDFSGWDQVATVMARQWSTDGAIPDGSDLAKVTDAIVASKPTARERIAEALRVVQSDVRYLLVALGTGNYRPQSPADTWNKRFGDCKAKSMLLTAMLRRMGITADPVLAHSTHGDIVASRLPTALAFDHVIVRAQADGKDYWLDGTSLGTRLADIEDTPNFGWVLPINANGSQLVHMPTRVAARDSLAFKVSYDASGGALVPLPFELELTFTGPQAEQMRQFSQNDPEALAQLAENYANNTVGSTMIGKPTASYDAASGSYTVRVPGVTGRRFEFNDGRWRSRLAAWIKIDFTPDRSRASWRTLPAVIANPQSASAVWQMTLPASAQGFTVENSEPVKVALPAFRYDRTITVSGLQVNDSERKQETATEVAPDAIGATRKAAQDAAERNAELILPANYPQRWEEAVAAPKTAAYAKVRSLLDARIAEKSEASRYADRAWLAMQTFDLPSAEIDYGRAIALDASAGRFIVRGKVRKERGNLPGALADAQAAYDLDNNDDSARDFLADMLAETGRTDDALALLDGNTDPTSEEGQDRVTTRADILARGGRTDDAVSELDAALKRRTNVATFLNSRCWVRALANRELDTALADCTKAIELASDPAAYYDSRAMVHFRAGRLDEARKDYDAALALAPELAPTRFMRAIVEAKQGDAASSRADLTAARRLMPSVDRFFGHFGIKP